jgi:hypothetical protein
MSVWHCGRRGAAKRLASRIPLRPFSNTTFPVTSSSHETVGVLCKSNGEINLE